MSAKRSKPMLPRSAHQIAQARKLLRTMPWTRKIELMVQAKVMTPEQAERAKQRLADLATEGRTPEDFFAETAAKREQD